MTGNHRTATLTVALLIAAGVSACGGGSSSGNGVASKSTAAIVAATTNAAESAKSVEVTGSLSQGGTTVGLDLKMVATGATGWVSEQGQRFNMVLDGNVLYIDAGKPFWTTFANAAVASLLADKWLKTPTTGSYASVAKLGTLKQFFNQVFGHHGALVKTATTTVNGVKVIGLRDTTKGGVLYVATTGKPYPIELNGKGGSSGGKLTFKGYGTAFKITPPAHSTSLAQLEKG